MNIRFYMFLVSFTLSLSLSHFTLSLSLSFLSLTYLHFTERKKMGVVTVAAVVLKEGGGMSPLFPSPGSAPGGYYISES